MENKKFRIKFATGLLFVLFFHIVLAPRIGFGGSYPEIAAIMTIWMALTYNPSTGVFFGLLSGLLVGLLTPYNLGWSAMILIFIGYVTGVLKNKLVIEPLPGRIVALAVALFVYHTLFYLITYYGMAYLNFGFIVSSILISTLNSAIVGAIIFIIIWYRYIVRNLF